MPAPHGFIEKLAELSRGGAPFVSVTLVETLGSTPQDAGSRMLVDSSGVCFGTIGGGRVESQAIGQAQQMLAGSDSHLRLVEWNLQRDVGMTCGGVVKLLFEAYNLQRWQIVIFGAGHVAQSLVRVLLELECQITCVDPRPEWLERLLPSPKIRKLKTDDSSAVASDLDGSEYVLCMTMGHRTDRPILEAIFRTEKEFPYLGVIGSQAKRKVLVRELIESGLSSEQADAFRCPVGLDIGTNQPGEIAVSVAAELIQVRNQLIVAS